MLKPCESVVRAANLCREAVGRAIIEEIQVIFNRDEKK